MRTFLQIVDSHTGGEPTRVVIAGGPELGTGSMADRLAVLRSEHDWMRRASVCEPRGSDVMVGALLCPPVDPSAATGVIFFNNVGYLGMCGHGTIGLVATLAHLGRITPGLHKIETPVGDISATLAPSGEVTIENVPSHRSAKAVTVEVPGLGPITGDIAYGGNWFFLVEEHQIPLGLANLDDLTAATWLIRQALVAQGITGEHGAEIDHIELFGEAQSGGNSRNFVLCPGKAYDRSPCGTGTSAKIACLAADGKLDPGQVWRQESIVGSHFDAWYRKANGQILPSIRGQAFVNAEATLLLNPADPFNHGIPL